MTIQVEKFNVNLDWDYECNSREVGTFNEEFEVDTDGYNIKFNLYINLEVEKDEGDYWNPPTFETVEEIVEITNIQVIDEDELPVLLIGEDLDNLKKELLSKLNYD